MIKKHLISILALCAAVFTIITYIYITNDNDVIGDNQSNIKSLVIVNGILFFALIITILKKFFTIFRSANKPSNTKLQKRILLMFSLGTAIPTIIVAIFSFVLFNYGIQSWFNRKVSTAIEESVVVAEAYLKEHKENIKSDALSMANDLNVDTSNLFSDHNEGFLDQFIEGEVNARSLSEVIVFRYNNPENYDILARSRLSFSLLFALQKLSASDFENANKYQSIILADDKNDRVRALVKLSSLYNTYLLVGRLVDSQVLSHIEASKGAANEYHRLKSEISKLQIQFSFIFLITAMFLLIASIARGLVFASEITDPIRQLLKATDQVRKGDFNSRVPERSKNDEISILGRAFNLMTAQIANQRDELIEAAKEIDAKRHFNEVVIAGVSAGIIAVDTKRKISVINKSACNMLVVQGNDILEEDIVMICPEFEFLFDLVESKPDVAIQSEINIMRLGKKITLLVRIVAEKFDNFLQGYIITFDDITALVVAQRTAAWSDVARRIAHEVRNPLTPIRLASERLIKKYSHEVSDNETFIKYIDTIIRHVSNIGSVIDEFVNFAKIPSPSFKKIDIAKLVNNAVFARQITNNLIKYKLIIPKAVRELDSSLNGERAECIPEYMSTRDHDKLGNQFSKCEGYIQDEAIMIDIDEGQIDRILINILKNAEESVEQSLNFNEGLITVALNANEKFVDITIIDNGAGFSQQIIGRLTEPYITTKEKGNGLGLAIVKKIIDDHGGMIEFANNEISGATVKISLPR